MTDPNDRGNGRDPLLSPLPPPRPVLVEVPRLSAARQDWQSLAGAYGSIAATTSQHLPAIYGELDQHRAAINMVGDRQQAVRDDVREQGRLLRQIAMTVGVPHESLAPPPPRPRHLSYQPERTDTGSFKIPPEEWDRVTRFIDAQQHEAELARAREDGAKAEANRIQEELRKAEESRAKTLKTLGKVLKFVLPAAGAIGAIAHWLLSLIH